MEVAKAKRAAPALVAIDGTEDSFVAIAFVGVSFAATTLATTRLPGVEFNEKELFPVSSFAALFCSDGGSGVGGFGGAQGGSRVLTD
jgi:hypothetical protein